jgi:hypothetical protein
MLFATPIGCAEGGKMAGITLTPASKVIAEGKTQQFEATAVFSDGTTLTWTSAVLWTITPDSGVTIGNTFGTYGLVTSVSGTGDFIVTATDAANGISHSVLLHVRRPEISITPANAYLPVNNGSNAKYKHQFAATGTMEISAGTGTTTVDLTSSVTWTTTNDTASVGTGGLVTAGTTTGPTQLIASYAVSNSTVATGETTVNITPTLIDSLLIDSPDTVISRGTTSTIPFTAQGSFVDGSVTAPGLTTPWTWRSLSPAVATIDPATGIATVGIANGSTTITATDPISSATGTQMLTILP